MQPVQRFVDLGPAWVEFYAANAVFRGFEARWGDGTATTRLQSITQVTASAKLQAACK